MVLTNLKSGLGYNNRMAEHVNTLGKNQKRKVKN